MPGEMEITEEPHSGKNGGHQKSVGGSRKLLQLLRLKPLRWRNKQTDHNSRRKQNQSPDERRDQLDRDMKSNWDQLPATLRRRKEKLSQAVLDQFTEDEIQPDLATDLNKQNGVLQKVSDDSVYLASLEGIQLSADRHSTEVLVVEENSASAESMRRSSTNSSQIIVTPQIHRECSDSSLDCIENKAEDLSVELGNDDNLVPPNNLEAETKKEIEIHAKTEIKLQTDTSEECNKSNIETHKSAQTETQFKDSSVTQLELENMTQEMEEFTATCSREITLKYNSHDENVDDASSFQEKDGVLVITENENCSNVSENIDDNYDKNEIVLSQNKLSETSDFKGLDNYDSERVNSENITTFEKLLLPGESCLYESNKEDKNTSLFCETQKSPTNLELTATKEFSEEAHTASTPLSEEEQQIMALLSRAVSEDSLLIPSSPSSTSAKSVTLSVDDGDHDSGTDINSPSPSTSSSNMESRSASTSKLGTDILSHYKHPRNVVKSVENSDEYRTVNSDKIMQTPGTASQDLVTATDSVIENSFGSQSTSFTLPQILKNDRKSSKISKHNEINARKSPVNNGANTQPSSSGSNCCFSSVSDDPALYEVVIPRAEYHKPSPIALKTAEYQVFNDKLPHEIHHDMSGSSATSVNKDKLACCDRNKTRNEPVKAPVKIELLRRDEEDAMSYYDAVVHDGQISNFDDCDDNKDAVINCSMHLKSNKAVMNGKEYEYIAKGLYINDYVHGEVKNQKLVCSGRSENGHVGTGNAFARRYATMEFVSGVGTPTDNSATTCIDLGQNKTFSKGDICCKDKMCCDKVQWLPDIYGSKWKRPFGLETLNKKSVTMATIMEEREGEADTSATTTNTSDSEKLTVREILRRFEELGGRVHLPADIAHVEGDSDAEKSATLRDIQETLRCLEEKVRHYETKAATTQTQDADENSSSEKLQQKAAPRIPDGSVPSKIALDGWTGHSHGAGRQQQAPSHQQSPVLQSHASTTSTQHQHQQRSVITSSPQPPEPSGHHDGKHSLLQFAMLHFRQSPEKFEMLKTADGSISGSLKVIESLKANKKNKGKRGSKDTDWTWKEQVDLVKFTSVPIEQSLLRLEPGELSELAVECFAAVMRYMGDLPMAPDSTEVKCVYTILMHCHKHEALRDEVYCQLMKQTTNNKSMKPDSCQRGWRLFSIVAAYFVCSDTLKPYLFKYLETAAYDKRRAFHGTATVCLQNLRKTFKYGGRKNVPSVEEITAISAGRNSKRQIYRLPGGTERVVNTKSTTVVQDVIEELCSVIGVVGGEMELEEFSLYCIVEGDTFTMPLAREEYILDVTTELHKNQQVFYLIFCRSVWHFPLRLDSQLYVEVVFNQIAPDYLEGLLLIMPGEQLDQDVIYDIAKMAALLHRAADMTHVPTMKETKFLLPKPALTVRDVKPAQWVNMVQSNWRDVEMLTTIQSKAQVLDILSKWPLFGSSFFAVKRVSDPKERSDHILALNRHGVHFIDLVTHETLTHYPFSEVISTRKVKSEDGTLFLDMKCGNLMQQRITRLQTDQAHEISRLIRQYITMEQRLQHRSAA